MDDLASKAGYMYDSLLDARAEVDYALAYLAEILPKNKEFSQRTMPLAIMKDSLLEKLYDIKHLLFDAQNFANQICDHINLLEEDCEE